MPKVLHLSESMKWSGGAYQLLALAKGLKTNGWDVTVACPAQGGLSNKIYAAGLTPVHFKPFQDYDIKTARFVAKFIDDNAIDVLHAHHPKAHAMGLIGKFLSSRKPAFFVSRRVSHPMRSNIFSALKYKTGLIDGYVVVADAVGKILRDYGIPADKINTVYSGVDEQRFRPHSPSSRIISELKLPDVMPRIGIIGNYSRDKGQGIFIKAAAEFAKSGRKAFFIFAGRDTDSAELKNTALSSGIPENLLRFMGFREDVPDILSVLDISVNAAIAGEALSGSIRESLAMGIPVIASDLSGNGELVRSGRTGELFPPGSFKTLAMHMINFFDNPLRAKAMALEGLKFVHENLTVSKMVDNTEKCYRRVTDNADQTGFRA